MDSNDRTEIVPQCEGCGRVHKCGMHCAAYLYPGKKWDDKKGKKCPLATHLGETALTKKERVRIGQQKHKKSKRG